jgi:preprotein translocase subunit SecA
MLKIITKIFGSANDRFLKKVQPDLVKIASFEDGLKKLSDEDLRKQTAKFREKLDQGASLEDIKHEAFATMRETGRRVLNMRHYDVQMIGGMVLHEGMIAEMRTGEGKTLVATSPLYLNALAGKGAHLVTVNDYLASRDAEWMGRLYRFLGMDVGIIVANLSDAERRAAYGADITYGTNNEFGFDYLRDNMKYSLDDYVQRPLHYSIIDEVDSILIDEARTPLIISGQASQTADMYTMVNDIIPYLRRDEDYLVDEEHRAVTMTDPGIENIERRLKIDNLYDPANIDLVHHVNKALQAHTLYKKDDQYMVRNGEVIIIDEFTGRAMEGRRWSDGLHQAIEAKEGVAIQNESQTLATVTFQNFFRMYDKLAGMTGTAETEAEEFMSTYKLNTIVVPTNRPIQRVDYEDVIYRSYREKFNALIDQILDCYERGQPVLVGTTSVEKSEAIAQMLGKKGVPYEVLNAKQHDREALIVAQAGRKGAVTIATNMAGRGTDIVLGGNPDAMAEAEYGKPELPVGVSELDAEDHYPEDYKAALKKYRDECAAEKEEVLENGGLFIIGTERHESRRIDNQLRGRAGRQGDPGASKFFLSLEDDLLRLFNADRVAKIMDMLDMEEGIPIEAPMVSRSVEGAQRRVEGRNFEIRKNLLEYDDTMDMQRKTIYALRRNVLQGVDEQGRTITTMALDLFERVALQILDSFASRQVRPEDWDLIALNDALEDTFGIPFDTASAHGRDAMEEHVWDRVLTLFKHQRKAFLSVKEAEREAERKAQEELGLSISLPGDDGLDVFEEQIQAHFLRSIDRLWRGHLQAMDQVRDGIGLQGYAQKDPKKEYKKQGYMLFKDMMAAIDAAVVEFVAKSEVSKPSSLLPTLDEQERTRQAAPAGTEPAADAEPAAPIELPKVGRNDPCPCGSGKKYKSCHMKKENPRRRSRSSETTA